MRAMNLYLLKVLQNMGRGDTFWLYIALVIYSFTISFFNKSTAFSVLIEKYLISSALLKKLTTPVGTAISCMHRRLLKGDWSLLHIGLLTNGKCGPAFESPAALKAVGKLQLPVPWGKLQCCSNSFSCVKGKDRQQQAALGFVEVREILLLHSSGQVKDATSANFPENK